MQIGAPAYMNGNQKPFVTSIASAQPSIEIPKYPLKNKKKAGGYKFYDRISN